MNRPEHPVSRWDRRGTYCEDYEEHGCAVTGCPAACWQARPGWAVAVHRDPPFYDTCAGAAVSDTDKGDHS